MIPPVPGVTPRLLAAAEAAELLEGVRRGWRDDALGVVNGRPLLAVDVTGADPGLDLSAPAGVAVVVVAVDRSATPWGGIGADVQLSAEPAEAPWVRPVAGVDAALSRLDEVIGRHPTAATVVVQLLRLSGGLSVADALVAESLAYSVLQAGPEHARWLAARRSRPAPASARRPAAGEPPVLVGRRDDELSVILNRPARRNAYSAEMRDALVDALGLAVADPSVGHVLLAGSGPCFSSGGDLDEFGTLDDPATAHTVRTSRNAGLRLAALAGRTTVSVQGPCYGAGVELPAFAGDVVARPGTTFTLPEMAMGLIPGAGGTVSIPRRIGRGRAAWLALSGVDLDLPTALAWGLVDRIEGTPP